MDKHITYFDKDTLIDANNEAIRKKRNRALNPEALALLDEECKFPVVWSMYHNDQEVRVKLMLSPNDSAWLDVSFDTFHSLPTIAMPTH